jgi:hypothetical protein
MLNKLLSQKVLMTVERFQRACVPDAICIESTVCTRMYIGSTEGRVLKKQVILSCGKYSQH